jgi:hypothetical protein
MQKILVTKSSLQSTVVTRAMLLELAVTKFGYTESAANKLADQKLKTREAQHANGDAGRGTSSADLECAKLRTILLQKFAADDCDDGAFFSAGEFYFEFQHLPDLKMGNAGKNTKGTGTKRAASAPRVSKLVGAYEVVKQAGPTADSDAGKWDIWQHVWTCDSFESFFATAPKKGVTTATQRVVSASSEIGWAVKQGWIRPVAA